MPDFIGQTLVFVRDTLAHAEGGHDINHILRVYKIALRLAEEESADNTVVALAALLHDISDAKFNGGDDSLGAKVAAEFLTKINVPETTITHVCFIIANMSFKGGGTFVETPSLEFQIVQDADRLDAIGAIGIARTFNYGGFKNRALYNPDIKPRTELTAENYRNEEQPTINHFYEKLLLLKDRMHTKTAKIWAQKRHDYMLEFLDRFYAEWDGTDLA
ncbi:HD domain-containing protein [Flavobacterium aurantiibacter]|uniref:Phosphohydrolase n=1 Tax=Flavobacterium aurantiibacter TaxID=2023067 RepID=A0A256A238_9FLAO|nr:HD domain-containing protein [Flavobacterium aurantiibacter]OYQ47803.1 phosphohydrolase [Flavobacterium aurantiibacter]